MRKSNSTLLIVDTPPALSQIEIISHMITHWKTNNRKYYPGPMPGLTRNIKVKYNYALSGIPNCMYCN